MSSHPIPSLSGPLVTLLTTTILCTTAIGGTTGAPLQTAANTGQLAALWVEPADIGLALAVRAGESS